MRAPMVPASPTLEAEGAELEPWLVAELESVPEIAEFDTADELAARLAELAEQHPGVASLRRVGTSAMGEPLLCLTIEPSEPSAPAALVFGLPHPNEPIGGLTALHLAQRLLADPGLRRRLGHRWHIVACIDPDGLRLNEGWLKGPFTRVHYARHFYRQAGPEQVEWTFPLDHKQAYFDAVLPETLALMRLIDDNRPALLASLHNSELGGVYYYLSRAMPELHPVLQNVPAHLGLVLDRGEPEAAWIPLLAAGIYRSLDIRDAYDHLESMGRVRAFAGGNSTGAYADRHGTLTIVCEMPYWIDERSADETPTTTSYVEALVRNADGMCDLAEVMLEVLECVGPAISVESPFLRASRFYAPLIVQEAGDSKKRCESIPAERMATVAERASLIDNVHMFRLRYGGMLLRALDAELALGNVRPAIRQAHATLSGHYEQWCAEAVEVTPVAPAPIRSLVATQYGAVIAAAAELAKERRQDSS
jgi:hypothetical protein